MRFSEMMRIGGNGVEGTFNKDMTNDEMSFLDTPRIVRPLSQTCDRMWRAQREKVRVCAYGEASSAHGPYEILESEEQACLSLNGFLDTKHAGRGFATAISSSILLFLRSLRHGAHHVH